MKFVLFIIIYLIQMCVHGTPWNGISFCMQAPTKVCAGDLLWPWSELSVYWRWMNMNEWNCSVVSFLGSCWTYCQWWCPVNLFFNFPMSACQLSHWCAWPQPMKMEVFEMIVSLCGWPRVSGNYTSNSCWLAKHNWLHAICNPLAS